MEFAIVRSRAEAGLQAPVVAVEVHLSNGLPAFNVVGMPETAVRESKDRVRSALINAHFVFPDRRITVNLAPADLPKSGSRFDLPIALGILAASGQLPPDTLAGREFFGELSLDSRLRPVKGLLPAILAAVSTGNRAVIAQGHAWPGLALPERHLERAPDLLSLCAALRGRTPFSETEVTRAEPATTEAPDLADVIDQALACRALEITAAGAHNLLLQGPPGTGKSMLARCLAGLLPTPDGDTALTLAALYDLAGQNQPSRQGAPFRAPHHSASAPALVGGGSTPRPGEVSLAHGGVLFLDELPEFQRHCLEMLREPLESGEITLSRSRHKLTFPARFQLVAAMNPCPCGYSSDEDRHCRCTPEQLQRYRQRLSGPLLDRIDLQVEVSRPSPKALLVSHRTGEDTDTVRARVLQAHARQLSRQGCSNAELSADTLLSNCPMSTPDRQWLETSAESLHLSGRALHRCLRVARTIADLNGDCDLGRHHLSEALAYRQLQG